MNRCPSCGDCLGFVGIRWVGEKWERWGRSVCGLLVVTDPNGSYLAVTREEPRRGYFNQERSS